MTLSISLVSAFTFGASKSVTAPVRAAASATRVGVITRRIAKIAMLLNKARKMGYAAHQSYQLQNHIRR